MEQSINQESKIKSTLTIDRTILLELISEILSVLGVLNKVLMIFNEKRETLEEKTIKEIFHKIARSSCLYLEKLYALLAQEKFADPVKMAASKLLFSEIKLSTDELLNIARYDLNFLEQYFEYDYCAKLHSQCQFVERIDQLIASL